MLMPEPTGNLPGRGGRMGKPWGRLYSGTRNHRKILALSRRHPTHWRVIYTLLEMSFETWDGGRILAAPGIPYTLAELSEEIRLSPKKLLPILKTMDELSLVKLETECANFDFQNAKKMTIFLHFESWNRRQFESDLSTNRTQKHRAKSKESDTYSTTGTVTGTARERRGNGNGNVPETETETDINPPTPLPGGGGTAPPTEGKKSKRQTKRQKALANPYSPDFERFYKAYPNKKGGKDEAWRLWQERAEVAKLPSIDDIMTYIEALIPGWAQDNNKFAPMITTFINQGRWTDADALISKDGPRNKIDPNCPDCHGRGLVAAVDGDGDAGMRTCPCREVEHD
jgi:hypothetical protein